MTIHTNKSEAGRNEVKKLLAELIEATNKTLESHAAGLRSHQEALLTHEKDLSVALESLKTHADCIGVIRGDLERLAPLVNAQSELIAALQRAMLRVVDPLGMDPPELPPSAPN
jgi:hypothetical protein